MRRGRFEFLESMPAELVANLFLAEHWAGNPTALQKRFQQDPEAEWMAELPPGPSRDVAAGRLVKKLAPPRRVDLESGVA